MSRSKAVKVGDILMLHTLEYNIICRVTKVRPAEMTMPKATWEAEHLFVLAGPHMREHRPGTMWWGPDKRSWKSVTNLGPCIPAAPEVRDEVSI